MIQVNPGHLRRGFALSSLGTGPFPTSVQAALRNAGDTVVMQSRNAVRTTDCYVRENSWAAVGASAAIGFIVGLLFGRR